jgi:NTE family protein
VVSNPPLATPLRAVVNQDKPVVALVLGSGAARGFAHVGVLKVFDEHGIDVDIVVGTSAGSVVGALYAGGIRGEALVQTALDLQRDDVADWGLPDRGVIRGDRLQRLINESLDQRPMEELDIMFACVATDLQTGRRVVFTKGNTGMAVRASSSVPGVFRPVTINGRDYVDGGLVSPVSVEVAQQLGADLIIAVDVSVLPEGNADLSSTWQVLYQSFLIMSQAMAAAEVKLADILIRPDVKDISGVAFDDKQRALVSGEQAAVSAITRIKELLAQRTRDKRLRGAGAVGGG